MPFSKRELKILQFKVENCLMILTCLVRLKLKCGSEENQIEQLKNECNYVRLICFCVKDDENPCFELLKNRS